MSNSRFAVAKVQKLPTLACLGVVAEVPEGKFTEPNAFGINYAMFRIKLEGIRGSRGTTLNFLLRPEWLTAGFDPTSLEDIEGSNGITAVYRMVFGTSETIGNLKGLLGGTDENMAAFGEAVDALYAKVNAATKEPRDLSIEEIHSLLNRFLMSERAGATVGYVLKQATQKSEETTEEGKAIYELRSNYEVGSWFIPSEKADKANAKRAANAKPAGSFRVAYEV